MTDEELRTSNGRHLLVWVLLLPVLPALLSASAVCGQPVGSAAHTNKGYLFSAISFADSPLGAEWSRLRAEALSQFPGLRLTKVEDLHATVVYIGGDWKVEDLDRISALALVRPPSILRLTPEVVRMGRNDRVVAVELHGPSTAWAEFVIAAKEKLKGLGLKKPDAYDKSFRMHITLAEAAQSPPSDADSAALTQFQSWIGQRIAGDPGKLSVEVGPNTCVRLWLAGVPRPEDSPKYITVEDFLDRQRAATSGK